MNNLYEALEICLYDIEQGADVDTVLLRYPELADELRPILEASVKAKVMSVPAPSQEVVRRNRAKLLQRASEMREVKSATASRRIWSVPLRRVLVSLAVIGALFVSSTGLVRASSNTLPGDNLYPVKRTWEGMLVLFTFDSTKRGELELEHEHERLDEVHELFAEGRSVNVDIAGYVTRQNATEWRVAGITITISPDTILPKQTVNVGAAVRVIGKVQNGMSILAERIELLSPGSIVPEVEDNDDGLEIEGEDHEDEDEEDGEASGTGSKPETTVLPSIKIPTPVFEREDVSLHGSVTSIKNKFIVVNGILMNIQFAEVKGTPSVGANAKVEGYYDANGVFIVTKIEFKDGGSGGGSGTDDDNNGNDNSNDNTNDDNDNDNSNDNSNDDNSNDDDDNGDNSGSGGGDDD